MRARWQAALRRRPRTVLAAVAAVTVGLGAAAPFTRWDADPELVTLAGSPELAAYHEFLRRFGSDELIVVAVEDPALLQPEGLARVRRLTRDFAGVEGVRSVTSLDTLYDIGVGPFGPFPSPIVPDDLAEADPPAALLERIRALPMARDTLLDATGTVTTLVVQPDTDALDASARALQRRVLDGVEQVLDAPDLAGMDFHLAGSPVFNRELERLNTRDAALFTPLTLALVTALLFVALRSGRAVLLCVACIVGTLAWVRGLMTWLDVPLNTTTSLLPPVLMVVSVSVAVHVLARYQRLRADGAEAAAAVDAVEAAVLAPASLTALTTAVGFASLLVSQVPSLRTFGAFAAVGMGAAFVWGGLALPAALRVLAPPGRAGRAAGGVEAFVRRLGHTGVAHSGTVVAVCAVLVVAAAVGMARLRVATHDGDFFPPDHALNRAYRFIESHLAGVTPLEVLVEARTPGGIRTPEAMAAIGSLQDLLGAQPETIRGVSVRDWIDLARRAVEPPEERNAPLDADRLARAAFVLEATAADDLPFWVQDDWTTARIASRSVGLDSRRNDELLARLEQGADARLGPGAPVQATFTGLVPVFARMEEYLLRSQITSFSLALAAIFAVFWMLFRSPGMAALALVPNLVPIALTLGVMGALGIPLDVVTVMVASVNLGIVVDDTIHVLHAVRRGLRAGLPVDEAARRALSEVGRAVVFTSVVLSLGFSVLVVSDFRPTARFGALTALTMVSALLADLLLLPALLHAVRRRGAPLPSIATEEIA